VETVWQDIRYASRTLAKTPSFTVVAVLTLALGIGATTSVFSVFQSLLFNAFSARNASRLAVPMEKDEPLVLSGGEVAFLHDQNHVFEDVVGYSRGRTLVSDGHEIHQVIAAGVTANAFEFYGVPALLGRSISSNDGKTDAPLVFVVSYRMWKDEFNGDVAVLGKTFTVAGELRTLIGVMPPRFQAFGALTQVWMPFVEENANGEECQILARLKPGIALNSASAEMNVLIRRLAKLHPERYPKIFPVRVISATDFLLGAYGIGGAGGSEYDLKRMLYNLFAGVMLLLLIACANVANLLLARGTAREKEFAVRSALGASRARLVRQLLVESALLALIAGCAGCILACFGARWASTIIPHKGLSIGGETIIDVNPIVVLFACAVTVLTIVLCGLAPAVQSVRADLNSKIAANGKGSIGNARQGKIRAGLVIGEVALSVVLSVSSGLLIRSFIMLTHVDLGFNPKNLIFGAFGPSGHSTYDERGGFIERTLHELEAVPGVDEVAVNNSLPGYNTGLKGEVTVPGATQPLRVGFDGCTENLISTMGLHLLGGRWLSRNEVRSGQQVTVLNRTSARLLFGNSDPIGQQIKVKSLGHLTDASFQVIGVAADTKNYEGPEQPTSPQAYIPYTIEGYALFVIKTKSEPHSLMHSVQEQVWAIDPTVVFGDFETVEDMLYKFTYSAPEFGVAALTPIAGVGLLLLVFGIFSVMAYTASLRTQEIGVRMALGAQRNNILAMVLKRGIALIVFGAALGTLGSLWLSQFLASQLWGVSARDLGTFCAALLLIFVAGIAACYLPARRATGVDPMVALRYE
jgi:predicted permease